MLVISSRRPTMARQYAEAQFSAVATAVSQPKEDAFAVAAGLADRVALVRKGINGFEPRTLSLSRDH